MGLKHLEDVTYFRLNNEINRPVNGQIMLHKDKEALEAFFKENVEPNTMKFASITEKIQYLIEENYLEKEFIQDGWINGAIALLGSGGRGFSGYNFELAEISKV